MNTEKQRAVFQWVSACLDLEDDQAQISFLERACGDDPEALYEAQRILNACREAGDFLETPLACDVSDIIKEPIFRMDGLPEKFGPYEILRNIGEGGMGTVYLARQSEPVKREVALKIIKWGRNTKDVLARFTVEYQALAQMNHANVACVFDVGHCQGRPYFTMEYFPGLPIHEFCRNHQFNIRQRLELFLQACDAVAHAHRTGIIHRDLKPNNILVKISQDKPVLKVIDFGIAKAINRAALTDLSFHTQEHHILGTPAYMSPEQVEAENRCLDTRTDVYGLGAVLYELLTGSAPFDPKKLRRVSFTEMIQIIQHDEPPPPSVRMFDQVETSASVNTREIRGDLDWITIKALAKDPRDRYDSVRDFAEDIRRHLHYLPVVAGPPTMVYKFRKFMRRHRLAVSVATILLTIFMLFGWERIQRNRALIEARKSQALALEMEDLFSRTLDLPNPYRGLLDLQAVLDQIAGQVTEKLGDHPLIEANIQSRLALTFSSVGHHGKALICLDRALMLSRNRLDRRDRRILVLLERKGYYLFSTGKYTEAEDIYRQALSLHEGTLEDSDGLHLKTKRGLATVLRLKGDTDTAVGLYRQVLVIQQQTSGRDHPETLLTLRALGNAFRENGRLERAESLFREVFEKQKEVLGKNHPETLTTWYNLAATFVSSGRFQEAESEIQELVAARSDVLGSVHPDTLMSRCLLGYCYRSLEHYREAETILGDTYALQRDLLGEEHLHTQQTMNNLALVLNDLGRYREAEALYRKLTDIQSRHLTLNHGETLKSYNNLADTLIKQKRFDEAILILKSIREPLEQRYGPAHRQTLIVFCTLAEAYMSGEQYTEAQPYLEHIVNYVVPTFPESHLYPPIFTGLVGRNLLNLGREKEAEEHLLKSYEALRDRKTPYRLEVLNAILELYEGQPDKRKKWLEEKQSITKTKPLN